MCFRESEKRVGFMRLHYAHPGPTRTRAPRANSSHGHPSATPRLLARNIKDSTWGKTTHRADTCLCCTHHVLAICLMLVSPKASANLSAYKRETTTNNYKNKCPYNYLAQARI